MRSVFIFFVLFACVFAPAAATAQRKSPPKIKASPAPPPKSKSASAEIGVTIERFVSSYEVNSNGTSIQTIEMLQRFDTAEAAQKFGKVERLFNSDLQTIEVKEAYTLQANGRRTPVAQSNIEIKPTLQTESAPAFSSLKIAAINFAGAGAGDSAFYKIRILQNKPVFENQFDAVELFPAVFDWKSIEINLSAPVDYPIFVEAVDLDGGRLADENGRARWQWRKQTIQAFEPEPMMFGIIDASPRLAISSFKDYEALGAAYWAEAGKKSAATPEIKKLADEITTGIKEPKEQAAAIYDWANRNIRYLSIVLGRGGWIPHDVTEILANRYGDCKDYTTLLQALLAAKNIESHPFILRADGNDWFPKVAVTEYFNHAILYIPSLEIFADATAPNTRIGLLPQILAGKKGFLAGARNEVIKIPAGKPEDNQLASQIEVNFAANGDVLARSKNSYTGRVEMLYRPLFADSRLEQGADAFFRMMLAYYGMNGTGKLLKVSDSHRVGEPFNVEIEINLPDYTTFMKSGAVSLPVALNLNNLLELEKLATTENRKTNLMLGASIMRENLKINFPAGVRVESVPGNVIIENAAGIYKLDYKLAENSVVLNRELIFKKDSLAPQEYPKLRELIKAIVESYNGQIAYQADAGFAKQKSAAMRRQTPKKSVSVESVLKQSLGFKEDKPLPLRQTIEQETKLKTFADDIETRKRLLRHYNFGRDTAAKIAARTRHRVWLIQNYPQISDEEIYGFDSPPYYYKDNAQEYDALKTEWLVQTTARKNEPQIRLNAIEFINERKEPKLKENLLLEGRRLFPEDYRFALKLFELHASDFVDWSEVPPMPEALNVRASDEPKKPLVTLEQMFEQGEQTLYLLKKERSGVRDSERAGLLPTLAKIAFDLNKLDSSKRYATELTLEFGGDERFANSRQAAHVGNTVLGRIALRENDLTKAKEHLLASVRAPQHIKRGGFLKPALKLARELFERGEKAAVAEYLRLCESFDAIEPKVLQRWQNEIKTGKTPRFDESELYAIQNEN